MKAILALEDGTVFTGTAFGAIGERCGEAVFNTSMTGYQEILTDPSYKGQIVTMTYPLIGNYGVNDADIESVRPRVEGFVVREVSRIASNWRSQKSLEQYLQEHHVVGIEGIDTRALTKHLRTAGAMKAVLSSDDLDEKRLVQKARDSRGLVGIDLVKEVTCASPYSWNAFVRTADAAQSLARPDRENQPYRVIAIDCGIKYNILRLLAAAGCNVTVVPAHATAQEIMALKPDGLLLSNGPGDPAAVPYVVETVRRLMPAYPVFGICLGHQMLGLACGGRTYKLKFGHRGGNQPVQYLPTGKVAITSQNHGFSVDLDSLNREEVELTHINLNDRTVEGMRHKKFPVFSIQYHPESSPGPHDARDLFNKFVELMHGNRS
jgi:carbamoyl-phosphate synthase small subunit